MSLLIDYIDKNSCAPDLITNSIYHSYIFNFTIGIDPATNMSCDPDTNATCSDTSGTGRIAEMPNNVIGYNQNPFNSNTPIADQYTIIIGYLEQPWVIMFFLTIIIGILAAYYAGALIAGISVIMMILLMSILGLLPLWFVFLICVMVALGLAFMGKKVLS